MSNALNWFEIPVTDLARAKEFYGRILQADLREESLSGRSMAILPYQNGGVGGAIIQGEHLVPSTRGDDRLPRRRGRPRRSALAGRGRGRQGRDGRHPPLRPDRLHRHVPGQRGEPGGLPLAPVDRRVRLSLRHAAGRPAFPDRSPSAAPPGRDRPRPGALAGGVGTDDLPRRAGSERLRPADRERRGRRVPAAPRLRPPPADVRPRGASGSAPRRPHGPHLGRSRASRRPRATPCARSRPSCRRTWKIPARRSTPPTSAPTPCGTWASSAAP